MAAPVRCLVLSCLALLTGLAPIAAGGPAAAVEPDACRVASARTITYVGVVRDQPDLDAAGLGAVGGWYPQFASSAAVEDRPTGEGAVDRLPSWVAPLVHFPENPDFAHRTFSQDGPARSAGGQPGWSNLTLAGGDTGGSGVIVDPKTVGGSNNTVNRIQLQGDVPSSFYLSILTDNTAGTHDPTGLLRARGNIGPDDTDATQVEADRVPGAGELTFDGTPDSYTFRFDGFAAGDYLKLRLASDAAPGTGASFGALLFDDRSALDPSGAPPVCPTEPPVPEPAPTLVVGTEAPTTAVPGGDGAVPPAAAATPVTSSARYTG